jgi:hypothetical protein
MTVHCNCVVTNLFSSRERGRESVALNESENLGVISPASYWQSDEREIRLAGRVNRARIEVPNEPPSSHLPSFQSWWPIKFSVDYTILRGKDERLLNSTDVYAISLASSNWTCWKQIFQLNNKITAIPRKKNIRVKNSNPLDLGIYLKF